MTGRRVEGEKKLQITKYKLQTMHLSKKKAGANSKITNYKHREGLKTRLSASKLLALSSWLLALRIREELKKAIEGFDTPYANKLHKLYNNLHFAVFPTGSIHLKNPSVARRAYRSPMPWGQR